MLRSGAAFTFAHARRLACACAVLFTASRAHAVSKQECATAFEQAQIQMKAGKLTAAKRELDVCSQPSCPEVLVEPCVEWLTEVDKDLPSIVISLRDEAGRDVFDAQVTIDDSPTGEAGRAIEIDPGPHTIKVTRAGSAPIEERISANAGEKNRLVPLVLRAAAAKVSSPGDVPIIPIALASAGLAFAGSFVFFGLSAQSDERELRDRCAPQCTERDADVVDRKNTIAIVSLAASALLIGAAGYVLFARPFDSKRPAAALAFLTGSGWRF